MPYISDDKREELLSDTASRNPETPGELNYLFTVIADQYLLDHGVSYQKLNDIVGALEGAKLEFYRRIAAIYENQKCYENGEVYQSVD